MNKFVLAIVLILTAAIAHGDVRNQKIKTLMEALGLLEMWSTQLEMGRQHNTQIGEQMIGQLMSQLNPSEEFQARFTTAYENFMSKAGTPWSAEEIVDVWASYYGPDFSDDELDQLINFYTSPLGQKDVRTTQKAMVDFTTHLQESLRPIMESATADYVKELQIIAKECNCKK